MQPEDLKSLITAHLSDTEVFAEGGSGKFQVTVIGNCFEGLSPVKKQQLVYSALNKQIADGSIHAVTIKTFTPQQWQAQQ